MVVYLKLLSYCLKEGLNYLDIVGFVIQMERERKVVKIISVHMCEAFAAQITVTTTVMVSNYIDVIN